MQTRKLVLALIDQGYQKKAWHGPNLKQSLRGVGAGEAGWRPGPGRHNIWELALHAAYWKYAVRRQIEGGKRGSFALEGSNFFPRPIKGSRSAQPWRRDRELLDREHRALRKAVAGADFARFGPKLLRALLGVAFHDIYHAGQIQLLRRLKGRRLGN